jgi:hypothetical protein
VKNITNSQIKTLVDICINVGTVSLGSVVIPIAFNLGSIEVMFIGIVVCLWFWYSGLVISKYIP